MLTLSPAERQPCRRRSLTGLCADERTAGHTSVHGFDRLAHNVPLQESERQDTLRLNERITCFPRMGTNIFHHWSLATSGQGESRRYISSGSTVHTGLMSTACMLPAHPALASTLMAVSAHLWLTTTRLEQSTLLNAALVSQFVCAAHALNGRAQCSRVGHGHKPEHALPIKEDARRVLSPAECTLIEIWRSPAGSLAEVVICNPATSCTSG